MAQNLIHEEHVKINYYDLDFLGNIRLSALMRLIAIASDNHSVALGLGYDYLMQQDAAFILLKIAITIKKSPTYNQTVKVKTWPQGVFGVTFVRNGEIFDEAGDMLVEWSSQWTLVDVKKRKILRPSAFPFDPPFINAGDKEAPKKIIFPAEQENSAPCYSHTVRYRDMDQNMHLNNTVYADVIMNAFPLADIPGVKFKELQINFINEAGANDSIGVQCHHEDHVYTFKGTIARTVDDNPTSVPCFTAAIKVEK